MKITDLEPKLIWSYFDQINHTPRPSKKEGKILQYLKDFAAKNNFNYKQDEAGNIVIFAPATEGKENCKPIILQSHVDMVCEKNPDVVIDFENDPIETYIEDGWVKAKGTTLGADCGIGMAASLAVMTDKECSRPAIEALFTVDEETGLTGANNLDTSMLTATTLLNLDSGEHGEYIVGCAGGVGTVGYFDAELKATPKASVQIELKLSNLNGGHSGEDISKNRGNAIQLVARFLYDNFNNFNMNLVKIDGGNLHNAIPRECSATITIAKKSLPYFEGYFNHFREEIKSEYAVSEPNLCFEYQMSENCSEQVVKREQFIGLIAALYTLPNGVAAMSQTIEGVVETSTNIASIKMKEGKIEVATSQRSFIDSKKRFISAQTKEVMEGCGAEVTTGDGYPGWQPNQNSEILKIAKSSYTSLFGSEPFVTAIHAGLECGLFLSKKSELDMVSLGPTLKDLHSPTERANIESVGEFYKLLCEILKNC